MTGRALFAVCIVAGGMALLRPAAAQERSLDFTEILVLGESSSPLFGDPVHVGVDQRGWLYVADQTDLTVKVFDATGAFIRSIGGRGRRVGQLLSLVSSHVSPEGTVLVTDQLGGRFTWFPPDGEPRTSDIDRDVVLWPRSIVALTDGYVLLYRAKNNQEIVHRFGPEMGLPQASLVPLSTVIPDLDPFIDTLSGIHPGTLTVWEDQIVFAPSICNGRLAAVALRDSASPPTILSGQAPARVIERVEQDRQQSDIVTVYGPGGALSARVFCRSAGLAPLGENHLAHFSIRGEDESHLFVEVFDRAGTLVLADTISELPVPDDAAASLRVRVFGAGPGRLAVIDRRATQPLVRVFEATLNE